jgi:hypothetical protein
MSPPAAAVGQLTLNRTGGASSHRGPWGSEAQQIANSLSLPAVHCLNAVAADGKPLDT